MGGNKQYLLNLNENDHSVLKWFADHHGCTIKRLILEMVIEPAYNKHDEVKMVNELRKQEDNAASYSLEPSDDLSK